MRSEAAAHRAVDHVLVLGQLDHGSRRGGDGGQPVDRDLHEFVEVEVRFRQQGLGLDQRLHTLKPGAQLGDLGRVWCAGVGLCPGHSR